MKVSVIIILYNPSETDVLRLTEIANRYHGVIVDNSSMALTTNNAIGKMHYVANMENKGIAEAQNIALRMLIDAYIDYIVFLDQDSDVDIDFPIRIAAEYQRISGLNNRLALLGPTVINKDTNSEYRSVKYREISLYDGFILRRDVISSGSCVSADVLRKVGLNESRLFIDYVDYEWCWRAQSMGFICGITSRVNIAHKVGLRELSFGKYKVIISAPFRYFYQYRNYLWLCRRSYVPRQWKVAHGMKFLMRFFYFPLFVNTGFDCWKYMCKGIKEGMVSK